MNGTERLRVGIDFSQQRADIALLQPDGQPIERHRSFANSLPGFEQAKALLLETLAEQNLPGVDIAGEATSYYWLPFFLQLSQDPQLAAYDPTFFLLNARWVHWYKKSLSPDHKDDATDPQYIADRIRFKRPQTTWQFDKKWMPVRIYTRLRSHLVKSQVRAKNLFQVYLFLAYTTYTQHRPFSNPLAQTSQRLLSQPELLDDWSGCSLEELAIELNELSGHRLPDPLQNARQLRQVLADRFPLNEALAIPVQASLEVLLDTIADLHIRIQQVEALIAEQVREGYPEVAWLDSIPGIGPVYASGIAAEIGDLQRFSQVPKWDPQRKQWRPRQLGEVVDAIGKYAGLWWPKNASGKFEAEERHLKREGNAYLRYYLLEAADSLRRQIPSYATYYHQKYDETKQHKHKRAVVLTGHKALKLFVSLLHHQEFYRAKEDEEPLA